MCGACDRRQGSLLLRFLGGNVSCISLAIASAASRCLVDVGKGIFGKTQRSNQSEQNAGDRKMTFALPSSALNASFR
jgi:hypothetical protein